MSVHKVPGLNEVVQVKPGVITEDGIDLSGQRLRVVGMHVVVCLQLDLSEDGAATDAKPMHLLASQVDVCR